MKNLKIYINKIPRPSKSSKWTDYLAFGATIVIIILFFPLVLIVGVYTFFAELISRKRNWSPYDWCTEINNEFIEIKWKYCETDKLPEVLCDQLKETNIGKYVSSKDADFFEGYFTDFMVERIDGVFVQKIELNSDEKAIKKMPLYFYEFESSLTKEIQDFNGYSLDTKGVPDNFMITGYGKDDEIQITLKRV